jgi:hypothetical protein
VKPWDVAIPLNFGHAKVVRRDCRTEPTRPRVNQEPEISFGIAVQLDEVVAAAERSELLGREPVARVFQGAG